MFRYPPRTLRCSKLSYVSDREMGVEEARAKLGPLVNDAAVDGTITYLTRNGKRFAAIVPLSVVEQANASEKGTS